MKLRIPQIPRCSLLLALSLMSPRVALASPSLLDDAFPYTALVADAQGAPLDGVFDITVQVFKETGGGALLAYEEEHAGVSVAHGELALSLGDGQAWNYPTLWEVLEGSGPWTVGFLIDGVALGGTAPLGAVPFAAIGLRVPSSGVLYGGPHGYLPAEAVEPMVRVLHGWYVHGDEIPVPVGWTCEHVANVVDTSAALAMGTAGIHAQDLFIASVGSESVSVLPGLTIDFATLPETPWVPVGEAVVQLRHAYSGCSYFNWTPACAWIVEPSVAMLPIEVRSTCVAN